MTLNSTREVLNALSELDLPEYGDVANAPAEDGTLIYVTGDGVTTPEGAYLRTAGTYSQIGSGGSSDHGNLTGLADDDHTQYFTSTRHDNHAHGTALSTTFPNVSSGDHITWDGSQWTTEQPPAGTEIAVARKTANQSIGGSGTWIQVTFDTNPISSLSGMSTTTDSFVPPKDGDYRIDAMVNINCGNSASTQARIRETTGAVTLGRSQSGNGSDPNETHNPFAVVSLTTTDEVVLEIQTANLGGSTDIGGDPGETKMAVEYLGA